MRALLRNVGVFAALLAVFVSGGGHWMALQSVAWGRMLVEYSRSDSLAAAVEKTFDGEHPCPMCRKIKADRDQEQREQAPAAPGSSVRIAADLMCLPAAAAAPIPSCRRLAGIHPDLRLASLPADPPPTPPPCPTLQAA